MATTTPIAQLGMTTVPPSQGQQPSQRQLRAGDRVCLELVDRQCIYITLEGTAYERPMYSYAALIAQALLAAPDNRLQLSEIYRYIELRHPYFAAKDERFRRGWQNSIRHNLSLRNFFVRNEESQMMRMARGAFWSAAPGVDLAALAATKNKYTRSVSLARSHPLEKDPAGGGPITANPSSSRRRRSKKLKTDGQDASPCADAPSIDEEMSANWHATRLGADPTTLYWLSDSPRQQMTPVHPLAYASPHRDFGGVSPVQLPAQVQSQSYPHPYLYAPYGAPSFFRPFSRPQQYSNSFLPASQQFRAVSPMQQQDYELPPPISPGELSLFDEDDPRSSVSPFQMVEESVALDDVESFSSFDDGRALLNASTSANPLPILSADEADLELEEAFLLGPERPALIGQPLDENECFEMIDSAVELSPPQPLTSDALPAHQGEWDDASSRLALEPPLDSEWN